MYGVLLLREKLLFLDCQTTGTHPKLGHVIELAWGFASAEEILSSGADSIHLEGGLVALPHGAGFPRNAQAITGLSDLSLNGAPDIATMWSRFLQSLRETPAPPPRRSVIHYARFEASFLEFIHAQFTPHEPFPLEILCAHQLVKRVLPGLPALTIRAVSGHFGRVLDEQHRAGPHVHATMEIWAKLVSLLPADLQNWSGLRGWMQNKAPKIKYKRVYQTPREKRLSLPKSPGVYRMMSAQGKILYVGKATDLNSRVNSYFRTRTGNSRARLPELMSQVHDVEVTATETCLEAALLENDEIKKWNPLYNASLKARARRLTFCSTDYAHASHSPGKEFCLGPFSSFYPFDELQAVSEFLETGENGYLAFPDLEPGNDSILAQGRSSFIAQYSAALSPPALIRIGRRRLRTGTEEASPDERVWTAEEIHRSLERKVTRAARLVQRARWICRLSDAVLAWRIENGWRWIEVREGQIFERGYKPQLESLAPPSTWTRDLLTRQTALDVITFDRMSVLVGEVRRLLKQKKPIRIILNPKVYLNETDLARALP